MTEQERDQEREQFDRVEDVSAYLKLSRAKIYELMSAGELKSIKIGASRRILRSSVDEFVARQLAHSA